MPVGGSGAGGAGDSATSSTPQHPIYSIEYYKQFFDVDSDQVLKRSLRSFVFWKPDFFQSLQPSPDLYGPFWIATTVVFILFVTGNLSGSIMSTYNGTEFKPDFEMLSLAASSIYSYVFLGSLALWGVCKYYGIPISLLEFVCIYGYSMFIFIPTSIACVVPVEAVKWTLSMLAFGISGSFIVLNIWTPAKEANRGAAVFLCGAIILCHLGLTLLFKFVFFTYKNVQINV